MGDYVWTLWMRHTVTGKKGLMQICISEEVAEKEKEKYEEGCKLLNIGTFYILKFPLLKKVYRTKN